MESKNYTAEGLHSKIRSLLRIKGEIIYGHTHVLNISEEEEIDQFSQVLYRVYNKNGYVFDCIQEYASEAENGAGGLVYQFLPCIWDGFEAIKPIQLEIAYSIIDDLFNKEKVFDYADLNNSPT